MEIASKVFSLGNSNAIRVPRFIMEALSLHADDPITKGFAGLIEIPLCRALINDGVGGCAQHGFSLMPPSKRQWRGVYTCIRPPSACAEGVYTVYTYTRVQTSVLPRTAPRNDRICHVAAAYPANGNILSQ